MEGVEIGRTEDSTPNPTRRRGGGGSGLHLGSLGLALCPVACLGCHRVAQHVGCQKLFAGGAWVELSVMSTRVPDTSAEGGRVRRALDAPYP